MYGRHGGWGGGGGLVLVWKDIGYNYVNTGRNRDRV